MITVRLQKTGNKSQHVETSIEVFRVEGQVTMLNNKGGLTLVFREVNEGKIHRLDPADYQLIEINVEGYRWT